MHYYLIFNRLCKGLEIQNQVVSSVKDSVYGGIPYFYTQSFIKTVLIVALAY